MESSGDKASSKHNSKILPALCHLGPKQGSQHSSLPIYFCKRRRADKIVCLASSNKAFCSASSAAPIRLREEPSRDFFFLLKATPFFLQAWASGTISASSVTAAAKAASAASNQGSSERSCAPAAGSKLPTATAKYLSRASPLLAACT